jgi:hypothetical protein
MRRRVQLSIPCFLLAVVPSLAPAQTYDLRGPAPAQGTIIQARTERTLSGGALTMEADGNAVRGRIDQTSVSTEEVEIVQTGGARVTMLKYRVAEDSTHTTVAGDAGPTDAFEDGPMVGETALIERRDDGWVKTLLGREPDERQRAWLDERFVDDSEIYPEKPVAVGDTWVVEGAELAAIMGLERALSADGKATFTLDRVADEDGDRRAVVSYRLELHASILDDDNSPVDFKLGGSGNVRRSLTSYLDVSNRLTGQMVSEGTRLEAGRRVRVTVAGPTEMTGSQKLITPDVRAAVVRHARADRVAAAPAPPPRAAAVVPAAAAAPPSCKGFALPCEQRSGFGCAAGSGCYSGGTCSGVTYESCFGKPQFSCTTTPGCFWAAWSNSCSGVATCAGRSQWNCGSGCTWQSSCSGFATPCESIKKPKNCAAQPGCAYR